MLTSVVYELNISLNTRYRDKGSGVRSKVINIVSKLLCNAANCFSPQNMFVNEIFPRIKNNCVIILIIITTTSTIIIYRAYIILLQLHV